MLFSEKTNFFVSIMENRVGSLVVTILATILLFGFLIFIHELGHYLTARACKVTVREFAIGMGPKVVTWTSKKTQIAYSLRALPIGGFVAMEGEDEESADPNAFSKKKVWQRMIITAAGGAMNLLLGLILTVIYISTMPGLYGTTVVSFPAGAYSDKCENALMPGDEILSIEGKRVYTGQEIVYELFREGGKRQNQVTETDEEGKVVCTGAKFDLLVRRNGEKILLEDVLFPTYTESGYTYAMRDFFYDEQAKTLPNFTKNVGRQMVLSVRMVYESLFDLVTGHYGLEQLSGPVGTAEVVGEAIKNDVTSEKGQSSNTFVYLAMMITVNLGLFNLLPVPALDGGRLFFQFVELIFRKPIPQKYEAAIHFAGIVLLLGLMALVTMKDIIGLFR